MKTRTLTAVAFLTAASLSACWAQASNKPESLQNYNLDQAQFLLLDYFPTVYMNGLGFDAEEWEQSIRIDEKKKVIEYRRRPFVKNNTKSEWYATMVIPLEAITAITEEHKEHTITIHTTEYQISCYNFDLLDLQTNRTF